jgi:hypothetical protein
MANRDFKPIKALERELVLLAGIVDIGGSGAAATPNGIGFTVAKSTTGVYTVTLADKYQKFLYLGVQFEEATEGSTDQFFVVVDSTSAGTATATVKVDNGAGTLVEPDSGAKLHFFMVLKNSSVT